MSITLDEIIFSTGAGAVDADTLRVELSTESLAALENITVSATDLDIRDLTHVSDSVKIGDGTDFLEVNADGSINVSFSVGIADDDADSGNPLKIGGRATGALLSALSADNDRYDMLGDRYRRTFVSTAYNVGHEVTTETIGATASQIVATPLAGRMNMTIQNRSNSSLWLGFDNTVTADNTSTGGIEIPKQASYTDAFGENLNVWLISDGAGKIVKVHEKG